LWRLWAQRALHYIISDRDKGLFKALEKVLPLALHRHCFKHIERNFLSDAAVLNGFKGSKSTTSTAMEIPHDPSSSMSSSQIRLVKSNLKLNKKNSTGKMIQLLWEAHRAVRQSDCERICQELDNLNPVASKKLSGIPPIQWAMWPMYDRDIQLLKTSTSNDVEQEMFRFSREQIRSALPYHFFVGVANLWQRLVKEATDTTRTLLRTKESITPYAKTELFRRIKDSRRYTVVQNNNAIITTIVTAEERKGISLSHTKISRSNKNDDHKLFWHCDYEKGECECGMGKPMTGFICEHLIRQGDVLHQALSINAQDFVVNRAVDKIWSSENFVKCFPADAIVAIPVFDGLIFDSDVMPRPKKVSKGRKRASRMKQGEGSKPKGELKRSRKKVSALYDSAGSINTDPASIGEVGTSLEVVEEGSDSSSKDDNGNDFEGGYFSEEFCSFLLDSDEENDCRRVVNIENVEPAQETHVNIESIEPALEDNPHEFNEIEEEIIEFLKG